MERTHYQELSQNIRKLEDKLDKILDYLYAELICVLEISCKNDIYSLELTKEELRINKDVHLPLKDYRTIEELIADIKKVKGYTCYFKSNRNLQLSVSKLPTYKFENQWGVGSIEIVIKL